MKNYCDNPTCVGDSDPDREICVGCKKSVCEDCLRILDDVYYCEECISFCDYCNEFVYIGYTVKFEEDEICKDCIIKKSEKFSDNKFIQKNIKFLIKQCVVMSEMLNRKTSLPFDIQSMIIDYC